MLNPRLYLLRQVMAALLVVVYGILLFVSRNKKTDYTRELGEYGFRLPFLAPLGLYLAETIPWSFDAYDRKVRAKIGELFGQRKVELFFRIHVAQKAALVAALLFILGITALMGNVDVYFCFFSLVITILVWYWADRDIQKRIKKRKWDMLIDLPEFINTMALLVNAGLPFTTAVRKVVKESDLTRPLYKELNFLLADINNGKPINQAYEDLAYRCKVPEITRFVSSLLQNLHRGNSDLVYVLRNLAGEAWERRKDIARKQGEEASSKLVFPMVMVFVAIALIVMAPAVMTVGR